MPPTSTTQGLAYSQAFAKISDRNTRRGRIGGGAMNVWHFGDTSKPISLVFAHANGFNGLSYRTLLSDLGIHAVAPDFRGHGQSQLPTVKNLSSFHIFADDLQDFIRSYVNRPVVLAGHSMGAVSAILAAPKLKDIITGYVGFDPVSISLSGRIFAASQWGREMMKKYVPIARNAGARRREFDSFESVFTRYQNRGAFKTIPDAILRDYLTAGLEDRPDGPGVRLSCDPAWEQSVFSAQWHDLFTAAHSLPKGHSKIVYAGHRGAVSTPYTRWRAGLAIGHSHVTFEKRFEHLFPFQKTDYCKQVLQDVLARVSL